MLTGKICMMFNTRTFQIEKATIVRWYGYRSEFMLQEYGELASRYPSLVDVKFESYDEISKGHFTDYIEIL